MGTLLSFSAMSFLVNNKVLFKIFKSYSLIFYNKVFLHQSWLSGTFYSADLSLVQEFFIFIQNFFMKRNYYSIFLLPPFGTPVTHCWVVCVFQFSDLALLLSIHLYFVLCSIFLHLTFILLILIYALCAEVFFVCLFLCTEL